MKIYFLLLCCTLFCISCSEKDSSPTSSQNSPPLLEQIIYSPPNPTTNIDLTLNAIATDADKDSLIYNWSTSHGTFNHLGIGNPIILSTPSDSGTINIACIVNDGKATSSKSLDILISLETGFLQGYIFDIENSDAIEGAIITIEGKSDTSKNDGFYKITDVPTGTKQLYSKLTGYNTYSTFISIYSGENSKNIYMSKIKGKILGYVYEKDTNNPVGGVNISIEDRATHSNTNGYYELSNIESGAKILWAIYYSYKTYKDTINVLEGDNIYDIYLEKE